MVTDLVIGAVLIGPYVFRHAKSQSDAWYVTGIVLLVWLGPFLGLWRGKGRGAALLCYGVAKLVLAIGPFAWSLGHAFAGEPLPATGRTLAWSCWHGAGFVLGVIALFFTSAASQERL